jgi:hypothetical protein
MWIWSIIDKYDSCNKWAYGKYKSNISVSKSPSYVTALINFDSYYDWRYVFLQLRDIMKDFDIEDGGYIFFRNIRNTVNFLMNQTKTKSVTWVRERTIPT